MKKLTALLLFTTLIGNAQIDYKGLVRNLQEVTLDTDINEFFKGLPIEEEYGDLKFNDERFLRFYGIIINKVKFSSGYGGKTMSITPFDEKEDYEKIKAKLIEVYGEPEITDRSRSIRYRWETEAQDISLQIEFEEREEGTDTEAKFKSFDDFYITFKNQP